MSDRADWTVPTPLPLTVDDLVAVLSEIEANFGITSPQRDMLHNALIAHLGGGPASTLWMGAREVLDHGDRRPVDGIRTADEERQALAHEFDKAMINGIGMSLGLWAGRGDYATFSVDSRDKAGRRALTELDALITRLDDFRGKLVMSGQVDDPREADTAAPTAADLEQMRDETVGNIDFDVTDAQLRQVWHENPLLVGLARDHSWGDTEARDQLCARLVDLGAPMLQPGQPATVGMRVKIMVYPHRWAGTADPASASFAGVLTDLVENAIVRSDRVRAAGAAVVVRIADGPVDLPPLADTALSFDLTVTVTTSGWTTDTEPPTLSEQVRAYVANELATVQPLAGGLITVDVTSLVYGSDQEGLSTSDPVEGTS